jgi:hypothetical protein
MLVVAACALPAAQERRTSTRPRQSAAARPAPRFTAVVLPRAVRDSMNAIFASGNEHWNELQDENTLTQMLGTGKPTQREYLGCLTGHTSRDTLWITGSLPARNMKRLQLAVTGSCEGVADRVGTWHTHPYRAGADRRAIKSPRLSRDDLATFEGGMDLIVFAVWDVDSLDAATQAAEGVRHPAPVTVR